MQSMQNSEAVRESAPSLTEEMYMYAYILTCFIVTSPKGLFSNNDYITVILPYL